MILLVVCVCSRMASVVAFSTSGKQNNPMSAICRGKSNFVQVRAIVIRVENETFLTLSGS